MNQVAQMPEALWACAGCKAAELPLKFSSSKDRHAGGVPEYDLLLSLLTGMSWDFWKVSGAELAHPRPGGVPPAVLWVIRCMNLIFNFLNALWFSKMLKGAIKVRPLACRAHEQCVM